MNKEQTAFYNKLRWRCRRGTRELDVLLSRYFENYYSQAADEEQKTFAEILEWPDPKLYVLLCAAPSQVERETSNPHLAQIVRSIHARP